MKKILLTLGCSLALVTSFGCNTEPVQEEAATPPPAATTDRPAGTTGDGGMVTVGDITGDPNRYAGQTVTVVADVEEVLGPRAFKLDEDDALTGGIDNDLLVISPKADSLNDIDDQWLNNKVRVTGKVNKYTLVELEREIGWDLEPELEAEIERRGAVLVASAVARQE